MKWYDEPIDAVYLVFPLIPDFICNITRHSINIVYYIEVKVNFAVVKQLEKVRVNRDDASTQACCLQVHCLYSNHHFAVLA